MGKRIMGKSNIRFHDYKLLIILGMAAALRCQDITQPFIDGFSWRQASTAMMAENFYRTNWNIFFPEVNWSGPGPNYQGREFQTVSYVAALLYVVLGQHDWIGRSVAIAFGVWGVFALYQLIQLVWNKNHALVGAAVMAVWPGSMVVERSFLPDPAMVALVTTCLWMLVSYLKTEKLKYLLLASFFGAWGCLTKITGLIIGIPALYAMVGVLSHRPYNRSLHIKRLTIAAIITLIPVIGYYLWARYLAMTYPPYHFAGDGFWIWDDWHYWWQQKFFIPQIFNHARWWLWSTPGILLVILGLLSAPPESNQIQLADTEALDKNAHIKWLFHWWLLGFLIFSIIGAHELYANAWNLHIVNPIAAAFAGRGIIIIATQITSTPSLRRLYNSKTFSTDLKIPIITLLMILAVFGQRAFANMVYPSNWHARQSYEMGLALQEFSQEDDLVVTLAHALGDPISIYYSRRRGWVFSLGEGPSYPEAQEDDGALPQDDRIAIQMIESLRIRGAKWLGIAGIHQQKIDKSHPLLLRYLQEDCALEAATPKWSVYRFLKT